MAGIQGAINSMLGSASHAVKAVQGYVGKTTGAPVSGLSGEVKPTTLAMPSLQQQAAERARQSARDAIEAKGKQQTDLASHMSKIIEETKQKEE